MSSERMETLKQEKKLEERKYFNAQVLGDRVGMRRATNALKKIDEAMRKEEERE